MIHDSSVFRFYPEFPGRGKHDMECVRVSAALDRVRIHVSGSNVGRKPHNLNSISKPHFCTKKPFLFSAPLRLEPAFAGGREEMRQWRDSFWQPFLPIGQNTG